MFLRIAAARVRLEAPPHPAVNLVARKQSVRPGGGHAYHGAVPDQHLVPEALHLRLAARPRRIDRRQSVNTRPVASLACGNPALPGSSTVGR